jgi:prephenate dehydrogenase
VKSLSDSHIAIIGLGLMGGSLAAALHGKCRVVTGIARRRETVTEALACGIIDRGTTEAHEMVGDADIVVLATPVRTILQQLHDLGPRLSDGCLVMDMGSTKTRILEAMSNLPPHVQPVGGHPMCGKELSGLAAADAKLYSGATFILSPLDRTSVEALELARTIVEVIGATPLILGGARQDQLVATLSHLPYLLACTLVQTADATTSSDPAAWQIVAGGYRDTTRVAGSDVSMMLDILATNRDAVLKSASVFRDKLDQLTSYITVQDEDGLRDLLTDSRVERQRMFP